MQDQKTLDFIDKAKKIHGNKYEYSLSEYCGATKNIKIICNLHGLFEQKPHTHLKGCGCSKCGYSNVSKSKKQNFLDF